MLSTCRSVADLGRPAVLSVLGVNIAPFIAPGGVVGLAIGSARRTWCVISSSAACSCCWRTSTASATPSTSGGGRGGAERRPADHHSPRHRRHALACPQREIARGKHESDYAVARSRCSCRADRGCQLAEQVALTPRTRSMPTRRWRTQGVGGAGDAWRARALATCLAADDRENAAQRAVGSAAKTSPGDSPAPTTNTASICRIRRDASTPSVGGQVAE